ncbi:LPS export ABC transporter periplasmic protein LptC [Halomonas sp. WWR20]
MRFSPRLRSRVWLALILVALGAVLAVFEQRDAMRPGPVPSDEAGEPDYFLEGVTLTRFDNQGQPYQRLETPRLVHTPIDDVIRTVSPQARLLDAQSRVWVASGEHGRLGPDGRHLTLEGQARLQQPEEGWRLDTQTLHYDSVEAHAWSDSEATLHQHDQRVSGERFDAWINEERMRLTGNVRGHHPPLAEDPS